MALTPDERYLYASVGRANEVAMIDTGGTGAATMPPTSVLINARRSITG
jgi:hypothetical protein